MKIIKKLTSLLVFLLLISSVSAISAGTTDNVLNFSKCEELTIKVSGSLEIIPGEYWFENCINISENNWFCECSDGYELIMTVGLHTMNNYTLNTSCKYPGSDCPSCSSSHRTVTIIKNVTTPPTIIKVPTPTPVIKDPTPIKEEPVVIVEEEIKDEDGLSDWMVVVIGIVGLIGVMSLIYFIYWKAKTPGSKGFDYEP